MKQYETPNMDIIIFDSKTDILVNSGVLQESIDDFDIELE